MSNRMPAELYPSYSAVVWEIGRKFSHARMIFVQQVQRAEASRRRYQNRVDAIENPLTRFHRALSCHRRVWWEEVKIK